MYYVQVYVEAHHRAPLYTAADMPKPPLVYRRPVPPPSSSSSSDGDTLLDNQELIPMSSRVLREICRGRTADSLPPELRQFATMEVIDMQDTEMDTRDLATDDPPPTNLLQQTIPQNQQSVSQQAKNRLLPPIYQVDVASHYTKDHNQTHTSHHHPSHKKSSPTGPILHPSNDRPSKNVSTEKINAGHAVTGHSLGQSESLHGGIRRIQPQRILLRGDSSTHPTNHSLELLNQRPIPSIPADMSKTTNKTAQFSEKIAPIPLDTAALQKQVRAQDPKKIPAKHKGFPCGPIKGPFASKYKWTRPTLTSLAPSSQVIRKGKDPLRPKKKSLVGPTASPTKRRTGKEKASDQAGISFNAEGFYEVQVQYDHLAKLASACGFKTQDLEGVLAMDNEQRREQANNGQSQHTTGNEEVPEFDMGRFDPDPEDELTSDEEA